jgi:predicted oxidoreductase (fatty acid repression mutant protein)
MQCIEQDSLNRRRSIYSLSSVLPISENCFIDTVESCILHCPTPFNVQSARVTILFDKKHRLLWDTLWSKLKGLVSGQQAASVHQKIEAFKRANGTILFFEDKKALSALKKKFPLYAKNMRIWTQQANGMLQYMIWQTLAENDVGASLQHYNELIEGEIHSLFALPKNWELVAQMPFGAIESEPAGKTFLPVEERLKILR